MARWEDSNRDIRTDMLINEEGKHRVMDFLSSLDDVSKCVDISNSKRGKEDIIDFLCEYTDGHGVSCNLITDTKVHYTKNFCFEVLAKGKDLGCIRKTKSDILYYLSMETNELYKFNVKILQEYLLSHTNNYSLKNSPKPGWKYMIGGESNTEGWLISLDCLLNDNIIDCVYNLVSGDVTTYCIHPLSMSKRDTSLVGQDKISNILSELDDSNLPHSLIILGEHGCGKSELVNMIHTKLDIEVIPFKDVDIESIALNISPKIILIDSNNFSIREQNAILKNLEEPNKVTFFIITCDNKNKLLPTIINRCVVWEFEPFPKDVLIKYASNSDVLELCSTPGECAIFNEVDIKAVRELSRTILTKIGRATTPNILTIPDKLHKNNLNDTQEDLRIFNKILIDEAKRLYINNKISKNVFMLTNDYVNDINNNNGTNQDKTHLLEKFLITLKGELM